MTLFPAWIAGRLLEDAAFVEAYRQVSARERALLKTCIARLHAWLGEGRLLNESRQAFWRQGFFSMERTEPLDWALVLLDASSVSPVKLVAAALPPLLAGARELLVARVGGEKPLTGPWPPALLTALELAGVESAIDLSRDEAAKLLCEAGEERGFGAALSLSEDLAGELLRPGGGCPRSVKTWRPEEWGVIGVWLDAEASDVDLEALSWAHPGVSIEVWGGTGGVRPPNSSVRDGNFDSFLNEGYAALVLPPDRAEEALGSCRVLLGPGGETCWFWPELSLDFFLRRSVYWTDHE